MASPEQILDQLPEHERRCMEVLAVAVRPINRSHLAQILGRTGVRRPRANPTGRQQPDRAISTSDLQVLLARWRDEQLVIALDEDTDRYLCRTGFLHPALTRAARLDRLAKIRDGWCDRTWGGDVDDKFARARAALYLGETGRLRSDLKSLEQYMGCRVADSALLIEVLPPTVCRAAVELFPDDLRATYLNLAFDFLVRVGLGVPPSLIAIAEDEVGPRRHALRGQVALLQTFSQDTADLSELADSGDPIALGALCVAALAGGAWADARQFAEQALVASRGPNKRKKPYLTTIAGPLLTLSLATGTADQIAKARSQIDTARKRKSDFVHAYACIERFLDPTSRTNRGVQAAESWMGLLIELLVHEWAPGGQLREHTIDAARHWADAFADRKMVWIEAQFRAALAPAEKRPADAPVLADMYRARPAWEQTLDVVEALLTDIKPGESERGVSERLIWWIDLHEGVDWDRDGLRDGPVTTRAWISMEPRLQKRRGNGWTSGRAVALKRLTDQDSKAAWIRPEDARVVATIRVERGWHGQKDYYFGERAALALVGHPHVYFKHGGDDPVQVLRAEPELRVDRTGDEIVVRLHPRVGAGPVHCARDGDGRLLVYAIDAKQRKLAELLNDGVCIPAEGESRVRDLLDRASVTMPVQSDITATSGQAESRPADSRVTIQLTRLQGGLRMRMRVYPLGLRGPELSPGVGGRSVFARVEGEARTTERDLDAEARAVDAVFEACPTLRRDEQDDPQVVLRDLGDCLEALAELGELGDDVVLAWPEGKQLSVVAQRSASNLRIKLGTAKDWFSADGELEVDADRVLDMRALLDALPNAQGRFIKLDDGQYLALTTDLLGKLHTIAAAQRPSKGKNGRIELHPLVAGIMSGWSDDLAGLDTGRGVVNRLRRVREAFALEPVVSSAFEAKLRPYQFDGFEWMCRLAHWEAGACLADDMGLGKTVQALAVIVERAKVGPALVVAPTSVCANWEDEAARFAPTLRFQALSDVTDLSALGAFDVLILSYTLLANNIEALEPLQFATVVLDEAQAIKNSATQRARAALRLSAEFRLATTGTPIENHLGEMWSLMEFLNPGLLGTAQQFQNRFGRPIQKNRDPIAIERLRRLVSPFILRRNKRDVLRELPPRTEIVLHVEPSEEERAFSEALRQRALARFAGKKAAKQTMHILAELTRLRRAACHPALVEPALGLTSAKLEQLMELLDELKDGGHRALVFSQFVSFLELVRARLDEAGLTYQYLAGSTSQKKRKAAVTAFQAGESDAFLISLKAGGLGLNLTAADYVIHLDPWWNPAVEDQASDRAHRIGQRRPVTVYKLVTRGSIEERVLSMHADKRNLAEQLLHDTGRTTKLDAETLLSLLRDLG